MTVRIYRGNPPASIELIDEAPPPPPPPPPPPDPVAVSITTRIVVRPKAIIMAARLPSTSGHTLTIGFSSGDRYLRWQQPAELAGQTVASPQGVGPMVTVRGFIETTTAPQLTFGTNWNATITLAPLDRTGATITTQPVGVLGTATFFDVTFDKSQIAEGWYLVGCTGFPAGWDVLPYPMYVRHTALAKAQASTPVIHGSYTHEVTSRLSYAVVPAKFEPRMVPLPARDYPDVNPTSNAQLAYTMLVPFKADDIYRPGVLPSGVWTTANIQNYFFSSYSKPNAPWQCLDGPRGRGNLACPTSLRESQRPTGGKVLFTDPWRVGTVGDDGTIHTEAGWVHDEPPPFAFYDNFQEQRPPAPRRLVGDWSAVPANKRGFWELWDVAVDARTTTLDNNAPPVNGEQPHPGNVVKYVTDTKNNRVCKIVYDGKDRSKPAVVSEFVTGLNSPWGCETVGNLLLVTESLGGKVNAYDMDTGALVWSVPLSRAEGIRVMDGFAYVGAFTSRAVWKLDLNTRALTKFCDVPIDGNSMFVNVAVSDGTFLPRGSVATVTWGSGQFGWPALFNPSGQRITTIGAPESLGVSPKGMYCTDKLSYPSCVSMGKGRMTWGTVQDGLHRVSAALATDLPVSASVKAGVKKWYDRDYRLVWSDLGFGLYGVPLPWGQDADIDAMLTNMGHS